MLLAVSLLLASSILWRAWKRHHGSGPVATTPFPTSASSERMKFLLGRACCCCCSLPSRPATQTESWQGISDSWREISRAWLLRGRGQQATEDRLLVVSSLWRPCPTKHHFWQRPRLSRGEDAPPRQGSHLQRMEAQQRLQEAHLHVQRPPRAQPSRPMNPPRESELRCLPRRLGRRQGKMGWRPFSDSVLASPG
jgi:hypothetical protein